MNAPVKREGLDTVAGPVHARTMANENETNPIPIYPCRYSGCITGLSVNPSTWPGDLGYCSGGCEAMASIEEQSARLRSMDFAAALLGLRRQS